ncbi:Peptidyl-prolyl cis-trans isomerase-like 4 [Coemansia sp. RSA 2336]|nr:Peptidyl-prolyl cis-trans isomerase-like 4 [Coemansia sp. RSA 2336]
MSVLVETSIGDIVIDLFTDKVPLTSKNFLKLCKFKYYNFTFFHSVERDFIAQAGDPTGTGQGGESIYGVLGGSSYMPQEKPLLKHHYGTVSMAGSSNGGQVGSQFFISMGTSDSLEYLDGKHTVIGEVAEGMDVLDQLNQAICDKHKRPLRDILIRHTIILDDPFEDPPNLVCPPSPLLPTKEQKQLMRIESQYEAIAEDHEEERRKREARAQALTLEMIGDLPFADIKPPENILFVCKLNPITQSSDLQLIFSRFGTVDSCQVVCDRDTGNSLGYAFVEFRDKAACEEAYFKMENVLIDDRRIHVDFSQSVSRVNDRWVRLRKGGLQMKSRYRVEQPSRSQVDQFEMIFDDKHHKRRRRRSRSPDTRSRYRRQ